MSATEKTELRSLTIFATNEHFAVKEMALTASSQSSWLTTVHYIQPEQWNINNPRRRESPKDPPEFGER